MRFITIRKMKEYYERALHNMIDLLRHKKYCRRICEVEVPTSFVMKVLSSGTVVFNLGYVYLWGYEKWTSD
jgi:hypothetical protein